MSKKTENIYKEIENLQQIQKRMEDIGKCLENRDIENLQFEMNQSLKNLRFWIESLYAYNGKSTSSAKQSSSRENGKKGGRPKKAITQAKRRLSEIGELLPKTQHQLKLTNDFEEEQKLLALVDELQKEKALLEEKLTQM